MMSIKTIYQLGSLRSLVNRIAARAVTSSTTMSSNQSEVKPFESIPGPGGIYKWPIIGTLLHYKPFTRHTPETLHEFLNEQFDKYGPVVKLRLGPTVVVLSDPKDMETVFRHEGKYPKRPQIEIQTIYYKRTGIREDLGHLQGPAWHALRAPLNRRLLKADSATLYLDQQNEVADDFVKILASKNLSPEELEDMFYRYAAESIAVVTFNKRLGLFDPNPDKISIQIIEASKAVMIASQDSLLGKSVAHKWYKNSTYKMIEKAIGTIRSTTAASVSQAYSVLQDKIKSGQLKEDEPNLLLSLLAEKDLAYEDIVVIMATLYSAGTDSTAKNIQVFLYNLARNPEKQELLRREIFENVGKNGPLTAKALSNMVYLKAALKESFRLNFPGSTGIMRILNEDLVVGNYRVPAGVRVLLFNPRAAKKNFENPEEYQPERWLRSDDSVKKDTAHNMIVQPFGHGARSCIGRRFALQEIYLLATKILQNFHVDLEPESYETKFIYKLFIEAEKTIKFKFTKI
ncbi:cytochrome P450 27C1-like [Biomphalaria glabrata]|uniref:Cytochrome P450 27C1-like n=1 Tax=Biomphalaria glabrata TaxID=6526 RepID=A0A9W3BB51_BIOGL|nr:cytochrome P450 27C1-like [Biomphalaria glabrata]XP_055896680.1 cytochrome P450 27C1-like [Biomphalaria glabrata]XP_055896681.1 cytochrome P450 27C1-like [Biomphalaria glabrata]